MRGGARPRREASSAATSRRRRRRASGPRRSRWSRSLPPRCCAAKERQVRARGGRAAAEPSRGPAPSCRLPAGLGSSRGADHDHDGAVEREAVRAGEGGGALVLLLAVARRRAALRGVEERPAAPLAQVPRPARVPHVDVVAVTVAEHQRVDRAAGRGLAASGGPAQKVGALAEAAHLLEVRDVGRVERRRRRPARRRGHAADDAAQQRLRAQQVAQRGARGEGEAVADVDRDAERERARVRHVREGPGRRRVVRVGGGADQHGQPAARRPPRQRRKAVGAEEADEGVPHDRDAAAAERHAQRQLVREQREHGRHEPRLRAPAAVRGVLRQREQREAERGVVDGQVGAGAARRRGRVSEDAARRREAVRGRALAELGHGRAYRETRLRSAAMS